MHPDILWLIKTMKKLVLLITIVSMFVCCNACKSKNPTSNYDTKEYKNESFPSFSVENVNAFSGEQDVTVFVYLKDNPGFLTMALNIEYDSSTMALAKVLNGEDFQEYNYVGPKNKESGCCACWFTTNLPEKIVDGKLLELHFNILENAKKGEYPVRITRPDNGGIVDENKEILVVNNSTGFINIK